MRAMFVFWNELLELTVPIASCTANMSVVTVHCVVNLPNVQLEFGKPQIFCVCVFAEECAILHILPC